MTIKFSFPWITTTLYKAPMPPYQLIRLLFPIKVNFSLIFDITIVWKIFIFASA